MSEAMPQTRTSGQASPPPPAVDAGALRKHPDLFTEQEAIVYLHLDPETGSRTLVTFREKGLAAAQWGKGLIYTRQDLDAFVAAQCKVPTVATVKRR